MRTLAFICCCLETGVIARGQGSASKPAEADVKAFIDIDLGDGVTMEFVLVLPGSFMIGSDKGDANEKPPHEASIQITR